MPRPLAALTGDSPRIVAIRDQVAQLLARQGTRRLPPLLITGETGTGKGLLARAIHQAGPRRAAPFVDVNCAAIPETLLEAELFGYERGAFTDARRAKPGLFQTAHGGTLFLDEIGLLPSALQGKLLAALEDRAVRRLGSTRTEAVDIAVLAATSVDLSRAVSEGRFRQDLYHRLAVITLELPPLRSRGADVVTLAEHFLARACADYGLSPRVLTPEALTLLAGYSWPGNVRELANAMERVALLSDRDQVTPALLEFLREDAAPVEGTAPAAAGGSTPSSSGSLDDALRARIESALRETGGNIRRTAAALGISRNTLRARMSKYGLPRRHAPPAVALRHAPGPAPLLQWERRHLSFLRMKLCSASAIDLSKALEIGADKVRSFGGRLEEASPSGAIAVFGLEPVDNASSHAALAALAIQKALARTDAGAGVAEAVVAIHCAEHLVSMTEPTARISLDGKAATWSELERLVMVTAPPGAIVVSSPAAPFLKRRFALESLGETGGDAWRLVRRQETPAAWTTRFVGRRSELDTLARLGARVEQGHGQLAALVGEAGIGKSRLLHEAVRSLQGWLVLAAGGAPYARNTPYFPLQELLRAFCGIRDTDAPAAAREKVLGALSPAAGDPGRVAPAILDLLGLLPPTDGFCRLDRLQRRQRTHEAITQVLLAAAVARPLCLIVEDLHWIDAETQSVLDRLVHAIPSDRVLLLASYRPGYQHDWGSTCYTQVRLDPLPTESVLALLSVLLGEDASLKPALEFLIARTEGNPLFLEEHVRTLVETGVLVGERGAYRLVADVTEVEIAPTVQAIIAARIARLAPEDRRLLQAAAVVGPDVSVPLLRAIADLPGGAFARGLERLQEAEFLCEARPGGDLGYAFKHALTHDVAYGSLLEAPRRLLHQKALHALERLLGARHMERVEVLAHHARCAEAWPRAAQYLYAAGQKALARAAYRVAGQFFAGAIEALDRQGAAADVALKLDAYSERWVTIVETGSATFEEHREIAERVLALADGLHDGGRQVRARLQYAQFLWARSENRVDRGLERALEQAREAFRRAPGADVRTRSYAHLLAGAACHDLGRLGEALEEFDQGAGLFATGLSAEADSLARPILANLWSWRAETLAGLGDFQRAVESAAAAVRAATHGGYPASVLIANSVLGHVHLIRGHAETALPHLEQALALAEEQGVRHALVANRHDLAHALALLGRTQDALRQLARASEVEPNVSVAVNWTKYRTVAASAYLLARRLDQAHHEAESGYSLAVAHGARAYLPALLRLRAEIALAADAKAEEVSQSVVTGLAIAEALGLRAEEARLRLTGAAVMRRRGEAARATVELERARELLTAMDMLRWLGSWEGTGE